MSGFCLLALVIGALSASALSLVPFGVVLIFACIVGVVGGCLVGWPLSAVLISAFALFVSGQVGYGLGLGVCGVMGRRKERHPSESDAAASLLHTLRSFKAGK